MPLGTEVNLGPGDVVLDGVAVPPKRGTAAPKFSVHVYCGQTAGWMKTPLSTELDLGPGHVVLEGDPVPPQKGHSGRFLEHTTVTDRPTDQLIEDLMRFRLIQVISSRGLPPYQKLLKSVGFD